MLPSNELTQQFVTRKIAIAAMDALQTMGFRPRASLVTSAGETVTFSNVEALMLWSTLEPGEKYRIRVNVKEYEYPHVDWLLRRFKSEELSHARSAT